MIDPQKFYKDDQNIPSKKRREIWRNISNRLPKGESSINSFIHKQSFALGFAFSLLLILSAIGLYSVINSINISKGENEIINNTYSAAINEFERSLPIILSSKNMSMETSQILEARKEQLDFIDSAIDEMRSESPNYIEEKQKRLRDLYRMKLKIIDNIIELERNNENY
ncbi:MAG: hypothetical protein K9J16_13425 [Melioribacteraceae bacterium]|nr:hypothetical protein [Melioribacteraceae bacterium]MCF8355323.1 hypothetical protein [Melioribacteraceae bacterium]MCF8396332.1 hypothetical protein [Melioribacteraceae bacterium]MCF8420401.1 hypothetical protein [Melioribacteraceae bacterium]